MYIIFSIGNLMASLCKPVFSGSVRLCTATTATGVTLTGNSGPIGLVTITRLRHSRTATDELTEALEEGVQRRPDLNRAQLRLNL
jgi:hypothetical protein